MDAATRGDLTYLHPLACLPGTPGTAWQQLGLSVAQNQGKWSERRKDGSSGGAGQGADGGVA